MKRSAYYIKDPVTGQIRFTELGLNELRGYFARAGIDIHSIRTEAQYVAARRQAAPYFHDHLVGIASDGPPSPERDALIAVAEGRYDEADRILDQADRKKRFQLISSKSSE